VDTERLIALIVRTVIEELTRRGLMQSNVTDQSTPGAVSEAGDPGIRTNCHVISEETVLEAVRQGKCLLEINAQALITPLASDTANEKGIRLKRV
jgi:hypothetical protein